MSVALCVRSRQAMVMPMCLTTSRACCRRPNGHEVPYLSITSGRDRIVAETNNGGCMVENTLRMIDPSRFL